MEPHNSPSSMMSLTDARITDVLPTVFGFLELGDRKSVRLTCRAFNRACNRMEIIEREKLVYRFGHINNDDEDDGSSDVEHYFAHCKQLRPAFEFRAVNLRRLSSRALWETLGDRITSLVLDECEAVTNQIILSILLHCSNLVNFYVDTIYKTDDDEENSFLNYLITERIVRPKLRSLKLFVRPAMGDCTLQRICQIFPNISTLGENCFYKPLHEVFGLEQDPRVFTQSLSWPRLHGRFVCSDINANSSWIHHQPHISDCSMIKLKEVELTVVILTNLAVKTIIDFLQTQTALESVKLKLRLGNCDPDSAKYVMFGIFSGLPKLKALELNSNGRIRFSEVEFTNFLFELLNLESLDLGFVKTEFCMSCHKPLQPSGISTYPIARYPKMTHLRLAFGSDMEEHVKQVHWEILSRCRSLRSLCLEYVSDEILKLIFKDHIGLRKLSLKCFACSGPAFNDLDKLKNLEHLDIRNLFGASESDPGDIKLITSCLSKLNCPNLKVFRCEEFGVIVSRVLAKEETVELLRILSTKAPSLETLGLASELPVQDYGAYHSCLEKFTKLRFLVKIHQDDSDLREYYPISQLFTRCPSLVSVLSNQRNSSTYIAYSYHRPRKILNDRRIITSSRFTKPIFEVLNIP